MRICIYCRKPNENKTGRPHAYPECLGKNNLTFDSGAMCDKCNNYFSKLENSLVADPNISYFIQNAGLPGKKGKIREKLSYWKRVGSDFSLNFNPINDLNTATVTSDSPTKERTKEIDSLSFTLNPPQQFNNTKFSRALHYIAFNLIAYGGAYDYILESKFDPVRKYILSPKTNEFWPYYTLELRDIKVDDIHKKVNQAPRETRMLIFDRYYFLNLLNDQTLGDWLKENIPTVEKIEQDYKPQLSCSWIKKNNQQGGK